MPLLLQTAGDNHGICQRCLAREVDGDDLLRFVLIETVANELDELLLGRTGLGLLSQGCPPRLSYEETIGTL